MSSHHERSSARAHPWPPCARQPSSSSDHLLDRPFSTLFLTSRDDGLKRLRAALRLHYFTVATRIQALWRGATARATLARQSAAAGKLQQLARGNMARRRYSGLPYCSVHKTLLIIAYIALQSVGCEAGCVGSWSSLALCLKCETLVGGLPAQHTPQSIAVGKLFFCSRRRMFVAALERVHRERLGLLTELGSLSGRRIRPWRSGRRRAATRIRRARILRDLA